MNVAAQKITTQAGSLSKQELILLYQSLVYIGLRKEGRVWGKGDRGYGVTDRPNKVIKHRW